MILLYSKISKLQYSRFNWLLYHPNLWRFYNSFTLSISPIISSITL